MQKQEREGQEAMTRARTQYIAGIPERIAASFNPIKAEMAAMGKLIEEAATPDLDEVLDRAGSRRGGHLPLADAVAALDEDRARR